MFLCYIDVSLSLFPPFLSLKSIQSISLGEEKKEYKSYLLELLGRLGATARVIEKPCVILLWHCTSPLRNTSRHWIRKKHK